MKRHYCTYFNFGYLPRALVLVESMRQYTPEFILDVLCFDDETFTFFENNPVEGVRIERLIDFEARNSDVVGTKAKRSKGEYFFTCTGAWILDVLMRYPEIDILTYLDSDLCFFSSPEPSFELMSDKDILIAEHNFPKTQRERVKYGRFNVGWLSFRNNKIGLACLDRWRRQSVDWCFDRLENGKFADQKYLDEWPRLYQDRLMTAHLGINTGPWAMCKGGLTSDKAGNIFIEKYPLVVYHFQGIRLYSCRHFYVGCMFDFSPYKLLECLYYPYIRKLLKGMRQIDVEIGGHDRYVKEPFPVRMLMGYWLDNIWGSMLIWTCQRVILTVFGRKWVLSLLRRKQRLK
jgi:hypothetical protein